MKFIKLSRKQIEQVYNGRMKEDFPANELRPLSNIFQNIDRGTYEFLGFVEDETGLDETEPDETEPDETESNESGNAMIEEDALVGYMTFTVLGDQVMGNQTMGDKAMGDHYLVDYLAIDSRKRSLGYGSELMHQLGLFLHDASSIIGEIENPKYAKTSEEQKLQERRFQFYLRNGVRNTGVEVTCFGVPFLILEVNGCHSPEEIRELYKAHYKAILPKEIYEANIVV